MEARPFQSWRSLSQPMSAVAKTLAGFDAAMAGIGLDMAGDGYVLEAARHLLVEKEFDIVAQAALIAFDAEHVIGLFVDDLCGDLLLAAHGIDGDDGALEGQQVEKLGDGGDLVGLLIHRPCAQHQLLLGTPGRDHMHRTPVPGPVEGAAKGLAVHRHDAFERAGKRLRPGDEAGLEGGRIERPENQPELVVARCAVRKGQKTAQERELRLAEQRHAHPAVGAAQHRAQRQQQHLIKRIEHLERLARVGKISKMPKKIKLPAKPRRLICDHRNLHVQTNMEDLESQIDARRYPKLIRLPCQSTLSVRPSPR